MTDISDIKASIQSSRLIRDEFFINADFLKDSRGRLVSYTGGYTVVLPCMVNGEKWAFRCWHAPVKNSKERYTYIGKALRNSNLPYFCSFEYSEKGLIVKGETLPITKMKWVEGRDLKKYICYHYQEKVRIRELAENFLEMIAKLHTAHIAHGDLQHGNIIVSDTGKLFLVDYDSMYVPEMGNDWPDIISGLIDYQHPARKNNKISSEKLDYFSELIIYTSLLGISQSPELVEKYGVEKSEALLFKAGDFDNFDKSSIYKDLKRLNNSEIDQCLKILSEYISRPDINLLAPIERYLMSVEIYCPSIVPIDETFDIRWVSKGAATVEISTIGQFGISGSLTLKLSENKNIAFNLISKSGLRLRKTISIKVAHRAVITKFKADKLFTYDGIPIKLSWDCSYAKRVEITTIGEQKAIGYTIVTPTEETTYTLCVEDDFGTQIRSLTIRVIPLPVIKQLFVPSPAINKKVAITYHSPNLKINVATPSFDNNLCRIEVPKIPELKKSPYYVHSIKTSKSDKYKLSFHTLFSIFAKKNKI